MGSLKGTRVWADMHGGSPVVGYRVRKRISGDPTAAMFAQGAGEFVP